MATTFQAFKYRIYSTMNKSRSSNALSSAAASCGITFSERTSKIYDRRQESMSKFDCMKVLTEMRERWPWLKIAGVPQSDMLS